MKKVLTYLGLILAACLVLVACANKPAEKKKATPTPTERAKADATVLIDTMLGKSSNGFSKLYGENYETWTETKVFEKQVADTIEEKGYTPEDKYTFKYIEGYDSKTPTQVLSKYLKVRRNMIGKIQDYKLKDVKVKGNEATVTFTSRSVSAYGAAAAVRTLLMSLYDNDIDKLKQWNQADNNDVEKGKAKDLTTKFLYGENFNGDLTQFKDIDKELFCIPLTGSDNLERNFNLSKIMGSTGLSLQKIIKNLSRIWLTMLNQKIKSFTLNVSIRICQTINLKIVATQVISYQVRTSSILLHLMLIIYGKLFWTRRVIT